MNILWMGAWVMDGYDREYMNALWIDGFIEDRRMNEREDG